MAEDYNRLMVRAIKKSIGEKGLELGHLNDLADLYIVESRQNPGFSRKYWFSVSDYVKKNAARLHVETLEDAYGELYDRVLFAEARDRFESFMLYMEKNREPEEKFYQPRINPLQQVAQAIQDLADDKLDELFVNMPARVGKTQIVKFGQLWYASRDCEKSNLYTAYSDKITRPYYNGMYELMTDPTYTYAEIFPEYTKFYTNGDDETIDFNRKRSYPTFTARSIYGTLNGACDCNGLAVADDLFSGIEEALNVDRQERVWSIFDNNFKRRLKRKAKLINMGTRWAPRDCQGRRMHLLTENEEYRNIRYRCIIIPALDENDESNFDYPYDLGYSTKDYRQVRVSFEENDDMASWFAQCQQEPVDRQGALFNFTNMRFFNPETELPGVKPDRIFAAVDEAFGGGDYVSMPVCEQYGDTYYIVDCVFNKGDKYVTRPAIVEKVMEHTVAAVQFEETKTTRDYREWCEGQWKEKGYYVNSYGKSAPTNIGKVARINDKAPEIREMYFLERKFWTAEYSAFMRNLFQFRVEGKNKHDDAPDSMAQLCEAKLFKRRVAKIISSPI